MKPKRFTQVFYIVQTKPRYRVCGFSFHRHEAESMSDLVLQLTGTPGKIIEFSRTELKMLGFKSMGYKRKTLDGFV